MYAPCWCWHAVYPFQAVNQAVLTEPLVPPQLTVKDFYMTGGPLALNSGVTYQCHNINIIMYVIILNRTITNTLTKWNGGHLTNGIPKRPLKHLINCDGGVESTIGLCSTCALIPSNLTNISPGNMVFDCISIKLSCQCWDTAFVHTHQIMLFCCECRA